MFLFVLGRQPEIGFAELAAVFGAENVVSVSRNVAAVSAIFAKNFRFERLGSVVKVAEVFAKIPDNSELKLADFSRKIVEEFASENGKLTLGFSSETRDISARNLDEISARIREETRGSFREVLRERGEEKLNSASVFHNKLTGESSRKAEIIFAKTTRKIAEIFRENSEQNPEEKTSAGFDFLLAKTLFVQNITSYTFRDRGRPKRDAKVGMLPPKLAQTIVNFATENRETEGRILLDAFVGTGVILQEAALLGMEVYGTDIELRMIDYTRENLAWVSRKFGREFREIGAPRDFARKLEVGSATEMKWDFRGAENGENVRENAEKNFAKTRENFAKNDEKFAKSSENSFAKTKEKNVIFPDFVAGETYLGRAYATAPSAENLRENIGNVNKILTEFLRNLRKQANENTGICLAVPAWFVRGKTLHLPLLRELENLGFLRKFSGLIYHREDQIVGRELLVLKKISRK